jgi:hypothetical protein
MYPCGKAPHDRNSSANVRGPHVKPLATVTLVQDSISGDGGSALPPRTSGLIRIRGTEPRVGRIDLHSVKGTNFTGW